MEEFAAMTLPELLRPEGHACACGRRHETELRALYLGAGTLLALPEALSTAGCTKLFVVSDAHTDAVAGARVRELLNQALFPYTFYVFPPQSGNLEPDERAVGALLMAFDPSCDAVLAVGSGVINDCCKTLAHAVKVPSMTVATAPSMDGYASDSASMVQEHVKVSLYNACPTWIIADTDLLTSAPEDMLRAGLGDMLAKYVSLCEWRISHLVTGEFYCPNIAALMRASLEKIRAHAGGLLRREEAAVCSVMEGLTLSGVAMSFAKSSRPASGLEHYFSHLWEMKALRGMLPPSLHGVQVGVGTCLTLKLYEHIRTLKPDREKSERRMAAFSQDAWETQMRSLFGKETAREIIALESRAHKNSPQKHAQRLDLLFMHWKEIQAFIEEELPHAAEIVGLMQTLHMATTPEDIGISREDAVDALLGSREIRDKYLTSSMLWDLGELDNFAAYL